MITLDEARKYRKGDAPYDIHDLGNCPLCQKSMKEEGKGCPIWTEECIRDYNYIENAINMGVNDGSVYRRKESRED